MGTNGVNNIYSSFYSIKQNAVPSTLQQNKQDENVFNKPIASVQMGDYQPKKEKSGLFKWGVGVTSLVAILGVGSLLLTRGGSAKTIEKLNKIISHLDDRLYKLGQSNTAVGKAQTFYRKGVNGVKRVLNAFKYTANITAFKDTWFRKLTDITFKVGKWEFKPLKGIADGCAKLSEKITMRTAKSLSNKAINSADELSANLIKYADDILKADKNSIIEMGGKKIKVGELLEKKFTTTSGQTKTGRAILEEIMVSANDVKLQTDNLLNTAARNSRISSVKNGLGHLQQDVEEAVSIRNLRKINGYVTENLSQKARSGAVESITAGTKGITNSIDDITSGMFEALTQVRGQLAVNDTASLDAARKLSKAISKYSKLSSNTINPDSFESEIIALSSNLKHNIENYKKYSSQLKTAMINDIKTIVGEAVKKKANCEIPTLQKLQSGLRLLHDGEGSIYGKLNGQIRECAGAVKKATNFEQEVYKRLAELKVGAAFTDYAFLASAAGLGAYQVIKQDDKEKMISASLTQGIPVLGGVGLCMYQTARGMTGLWPLMIALVGGKILNMIGSSVSDKYVASTNAKRAFLNELITLRSAQNNNVTANQKLS